MKKIDKAMWWFNAILWLISLIVLIAFLDANETTRNTNAGLLSVLALSTTSTNMLNLSKANKEQSK